MQSIAVACFKISKVLKYPLVFVVFNLLFLFCISQNGIFSNLLFAFFFSFFALVLFSLLLKKFVFSKEKKIIISEIQYEEIDKYTLIYSFFPLLRAFIANATPASLGFAGGAAGAAAAAEYHSNSSQARAAEWVANYHENEAAACEAAGRPANAAHHRNLAHSSRTQETLRPIGGPILGGAYTALQEDLPNASTSRHQEEMRLALNQTKDTKRQLNLKQKGSRSSRVRIVGTTW